MPHARKVENPVIPTLLARDTRHAFLLQCVEVVVYWRRVGIRFWRFLLPIRFHTARDESLGGRGYYAGTAFLVIVRFSHHRDGLNRRRPAHGTTQVLEGTG